MFEPVETATEPVGDGYEEVNLPSFEETTPADGSERDSDGMLTCPKCGGKYKRLGRHLNACDGTTKVSTGGAGAKSKPTSSRNRAPEGVLDFLTAVGAGLTEYSAANVIAKTIPCDPRLVPSDIPDGQDHTMFYPLINGAWPRIPKKAQRFVKSLSDERALIACAFAWSEYVKTLSDWRRETRAAMVMQARNVGRNGTSEPASPSFSTPTGEYPEPFRPNG